MHLNNKLSKFKPITTNWRILLYVVLLLLAVIVVSTQHKNISTAFSYALLADKALLVWALIVFLCSVIASSLVYANLSPVKLIFQHTLLIQSAGLFAGKLLPAGSGSLGVSYLYLRNQKINKLTAIAVVTVNNILGFTGHMFLLFIALFFISDNIALKSSAQSQLSNLIHFLPFAILAIFSIFYLLSRSRLKSFSKFVNQIKPVIIIRNKLLMALLCSMLVTICYVTCLWLTALSLSIDINIATALLILSFGVIGSSVVPLPGGIGGTEAGIYLGLVIIGIAPDTSLALSFVFRLISFWLPLILGSVAFAFVTKKRYLSF